MDILAKFTEFLEKFKSLEVLFRSLPF